MQTAFREMHTCSVKAAANCRVPWEHLSGLSSSGYISPLRTPSGACLVVQWLRIRLAMQGTLVRSLVQEDLTCCRTAKTAPQLLSQSSRAREPTLLSPCDSTLRSATREATSVAWLQCQLLPPSQSEKRHHLFELQRDLFSPFGKSGHRIYENKKHDGVG